MKQLLALTIIFLFIRCGKEPKADIETETHSDTITAASPESKIFIKDRSLYSPEWVAALEASDYPNPISVMGDKLFVEGDTITFPDELRLNEGYHFTAFTDTHFYQLDVTRVNATAIDYDFSLFKDEKVVYNRKGRAILGALFFLGDESFIDDETGTGYLATEYSDYTPDGMTIDIGEEDDDGRIRVHIDSPGNQDTGITLRQNL